MARKQTLFHRHPVTPTDGDAISKAAIAVLRRETEHPLLLKPQDLPQEVIRRFGRAAFEKRLGELFLPPLSHPTP